VTGPPVEGQDAVLTPEALDFVAALHREFGARRDELLAARRTRRDAVSKTGQLDFLEETRSVREGDWRVAPAPEDLLDRRVEEPDRPAATPRPPADHGPGKAKCLPWNPGG